MNPFLIEGLLWTCEGTFDRKHNHNVAPQLYGLLSVKVYPGFRNYIISKKDKEFYTLTGNILSNKDK